MCKNLKYLLKKRTIKNCIVKMSNVMIDLETFGIKQGSAIVSIAAIEFNPVTGKEGRSFYQKIDIQSAIDKGLTIDGETIIWWFKQHESVRSQLYTTDGKLNEVLTNFTAFMRSINSNPKDVKVWGNGSSFDLGLLSHAYNVCKMEIPWHFWNERDVRTIVDLNPNVKRLTPFVGIQHHPLEDCRHQIKYVCGILSTLNVKKV
jgi:hypothetical protein